MASLVLGPPGVYGLDVICDLVTERAGILGGGKHRRAVLRLGLLSGRGMLGVSTQRYVNRNRNIRKVLPCYGFPRFSDPEIQTTFNLKILGVPKQTECSRRSHELLSAFLTGEPCGNPSPVGPLGSYYTWNHIAFFGCRIMP